MAYCKKEKPGNSVTSVDLVRILFCNALKPDLESLNKSAKFKQGHNEKDQKFT